MNQLEITYPQLEEMAERPELVKPRLEDISLHAKQLWHDGAISAAKRLLKKTKFNDNGCLEWMGSKADGYGVIGIGDSKTFRVHRVAYILWKGPIPEELCVLHNCDNRACIALSHLRIGTQKQNNEDTYKRGRRGSIPNQGHFNGRCILTESQVIEIRKLYLEFQAIRKENNASALARKFGVKPGTIHSIIGGVNWKHLK